MKRKFASLSRRFLSPLSTMRYWAILLAMGASLVLSLPTTTAAQESKNNACDGVGAVTGQTGCGTDGLQDIIRNVINIFGIVIGVASLFMVMFGAFRYITSGGESAKVNTSKNTILYALIGLVIAVFSQIIIRTVLHKSLYGSISPVIFFLNR